MSISISVIPLGIENLKRARATLESLAGALASKATDKLRVSVVDAIPLSPFNLTQISGITLTGRDWSQDFAKLQNLDTALSSRASESTLAKVFASVVGVEFGVSGKGVAFPSFDAPQWEDRNTYTVTETGWTEKTRLWFRPRSTRHAVYYMYVVIYGYVSASGQTMYVRIRSFYRGVLLSFTFTETSNTPREGRVLYVKYPWWDDPIMIEAYVASSGQTGYITYVQINFIPLEGLVSGYRYDVNDFKPIAIDADGMLLTGINKVSGATLTPRDWSQDFAKLQNIDTALSSFTGSPGGSAPSKGVVMLGFDGTYLRIVKTTSDGKLLAVLG